MWRRRKRANEEQQANVEVDKRAKRRTMGTREKKKGKRREVTY